MPEPTDQELEIDLIVIGRPIVMHNDGVNRDHEHLKFYIITAMPLIRCRHTLDLAVFDNQAQMRDNRPECYRRVTLHNVTLPPGANGWHPLEN